MAELVGGERALQVDIQADGAGEDQAGVLNASPLWKGIRVVGGGQGMVLTKNVVPVEEQANVTAQPADILSHFVPAGTVQVIPSPWDTGVTFGVENRTVNTATRSLLRWLLDSAIIRTGGVLQSFTYRELIGATASNANLTTEFHGCKTNGLTLSYSSGGGTGGFLDVSADLRGLNGGRLHTASTSAPTFPSSRHWIVSQVGVQLGADLAGSANNRTVTDFSLNITNNLADEAVTYWYPDSTSRAAQTSMSGRRLGLSGLLEGDLEVTGSVTFRFTSDDWFDRFLEVDPSDTVGALRLLCFHSDSDKFTPDADVITNPAGDEVITFNEDVDAADLAVGDCIYIEDSAAADPASWTKEVQYVEAVSLAGGAGTDTADIDCDSDVDEHCVGRNITHAQATTRIYTKGMEIRIPEFRVINHTLGGGARDKLTQTIEFQAQIPTSGALHMDDGTTDLPIEYIVR